MRKILDNHARAVEAEPAAARIKLLETVGVSPLVEKRRTAAIKAYGDATASLLPVPPPDSGLDRRALAGAFASGVNGMLTDWVAGSLDMRANCLVNNAFLLFQGLERELQARSAR